MDCGECFPRSRLQQCGQPCVLLLVALNTLRQYGTQCRKYANFSPLVQRAIPYPIRNMVMPNRENGIGAWFTARHTPKVVRQAVQAAPYRHLIPPGAQRTVYA